MKKNIMLILMIAFPLRCFRYSTRVPSLYVLIYRALVLYRLLFFACLERASYPHRCKVRMSDHPLGVNLARDRNTPAPGVSLSSAVILNKKPDLHPSLQSNKIIRCCRLAQWFHPFQNIYTKKQTLYMRWKGLVLLAFRILFKHLRRESHLNNV
jgi:hypothetical protein